MRNLSKKAKTIIAGAAIAGLAGSGVAYAYWTTTGSGTGSAATSAGAASLVVTQTAAPTNMFPGDAPAGIAGTVKNTAANSAYVAKVVVSISSIEQTPAGVAAGTCTTADYSLSSPTMSIGSDVATNATVSFSGATLQFNNLATANQDGCKGATVHLAYAAS